MHIEFERTGGFTGMPLSARIDTATLPAEQARALQDVVDDAHFFHLPARISAPAQAADVYHYHVTIESAGQRHTVDADEIAASPALQTLLQQLSQLARATRGT